MKSQKPASIVLLLKNLNEHDISVLESHSFSDHCLSIFLKIKTTTENKEYVFRDLSFLTEKNQVFEIQNLMKTMLELSEIL